MKRLLAAIAITIIAAATAAAATPDSTLVSLHERWSPITCYSPELMGQELADYAAAYPSVVTVDTIGTSVEGRPLLMATMGTGPHNIFALGAIHGREYISTTMLLKDIEQMTLATAVNGRFGDYDINAILDSCTIYIVPMMNPDGVDISQRGDEGRSDEFRNIEIDPETAHIGYPSWKANANGVDLNRNFAYGWDDNHRSPERPSSNEHKGPHPESEPETTALIDILQQVKPEGVLSYHTQGEILYISDPTPKAKRLGKLISRLTGYPRRPAGRPYGSLQDHVDDEHEVFYVCVELCPYIGPYPYPDELFFEKVWPRARYVLPLAAQVLGNLAK